MTAADKDIERERYDARARAQLAEAASAAPARLGSQAMAAYLRTPYLVYEAQLASTLRPGQHVLELGAGVGAHTRALLATGAEVLASDISPHSLQVLAARFPGETRLQTAVADMERLPFANHSFDAVACAGSLSYGAPALVDGEIRRVLRPGGALVCVDSLNHSPVYRFNRWVQYARGRRTRRTIQQMPDLARIAALAAGFADSQVFYFGAASFAMPVVARCVGAERARQLSDRIDRWLGTRRSAFKFVLVARHLADSPRH